jgi:hypothetical protein
MAISIHAEIQKPAAEVPAKLQKKVAPVAEVSVKPSLSKSCNIREILGRFLL